MRASAHGLVESSKGTLYVEQPTGHRLGVILATSARATSYVKPGSDALLARCRD